MVCDGVHPDHRGLRHGGPSSCTSSVYTHCLSWGHEPCLQLHGLPFGDRNLLLGLGSHWVQLSSKEGSHFFCHQHVLGLKLLDMLDQLQDAGCL